MAHVLQSRLRIQKILRTQYASTTQPQSIARCRQVPVHNRKGWGDLTDAGPGLSPLSAYLLYP